jgi:dTDP-4-amino-4,6-dideoxygalactose transaminase
MLNAISRYGARFAPGVDALVERHLRAGTLIEGPELPAFERAFAARAGGGHAVTASYGRMAAYDIFRALELPPGSEVVFPALTFWVVPEMARAAGLKVVFADVDPRSFNLDPASLESVLTPRTRAVVPTHIYGLPCDMDEIMAIARKRSLAVVEDCAHALGASHRGRPVGTFGDAALFSFQVLKPLNTCGGGMAFTRRADLAARLRAFREARPLPEVARVRERLRLARLERALMRPKTFTLSVFPILWAASCFRARPDVYLWEKVRPLWPLPPGYDERYANVQAALGLLGLDHLDAWTERTRANAHEMSRALSGIPGVVTPPQPTDRCHVYYQFAVYVRDHDETARRCLRRGLDVEFHHMDVCPDLPLFAESRCDAPGARRTADSLQIPVHAGLDAPLLALVERRLRSALLGPQPTPASAARAL